MGIGYTIIVEKDVQTTLTTLRAMDTTAYEIGEIIKMMIHLFIYWR